MESRASRLGLLRKRPLSAIRCMIIHTTGSGPWSRYKSGEFASPFDAALHIYTKVMRYSPHILIDGDTGHLEEICDHRLVAEHTGSTYHRRYIGSAWKRTCLEKTAAWFPKKWAPIFGFDNPSPAMLASGELWAKGSANLVSIGLEVTPPKKGPREAWSKLAHKSLVEVATTLSKTYGFPNNDFHIISHSDANPLSRSTESGFPYDPGSKQWKLYSSLGGPSLNPL